MNIRRQIVKNVEAEKSTSIKEPHSIEKAASLLAITDLFLLLFSGCILYWYYVGLNSTNYALYTFGIFSPAILVIAVFEKVNLYRINSITNPTSILFKIFCVLSVIFLVFLALAFALKISHHFSRVWVFSWFSLSVFLMWVSRGLYYYIFLRLAKSGKISRKIIVVGTGKQGKKFLENLQLINNPWVSVVGIFDDRKNRLGPTFMGIPVLGTIDDLIDYARYHRLDDIIINLPWSADSRLKGIIMKLRELPINIRLGSDLVGFQKFDLSFSSIFEIPLLNIARKPLGRWKFGLKVVEDKILSVIFLAVFSPLMFLIALAVKLESPGPILFRQKRFGFNNKQFSVLKFRTMYQNKNLENKVDQAQKNDPRITPLGKFLRRTSLDELPQLLNVLGGTMSIVGPRPHAVEHNKKYSKMILGYFSRHRVKPGITGWAQVNGLRGETEVVGKMAARVKYDIFYIENWSFLFDIKILFRTISAVTFPKNAY